MVSGARLSEISNAAFGRSRNCSWAQDRLRQCRHSSASLCEIGARCCCRGRLGPRIPATQEAILFGSSRRWARSCCIFCPARYQRLSAEGDRPANTSIPLADFRRPIDVEWVNHPWTSGRSRTVIMISDMIVLQHGLLKTHLGTSMSSAGDYTISCAAPHHFLIERERRRGTPISAFAPILLPGVAGSELKTEMPDLSAGQP